MRRSIILIIGLILLLGLIYGVWKCSSHKDTVSISIVMLESSNDTLRRNNLVDNIVKEIGEKKQDVEINFYSIEKGWSPLIQVNKPKGLEKAIAWDNRLRSALISTISSKKTPASLTDKQTNSCLEALVQRVLEQAEKDDKTVVVVAGLFPVCYKNISSSTIIQKVNERLKGVKPGNSVNILWCVEDTRKNEEHILQALQKLNVGVEDKRIITTERFCSEQVSSKMYAGHSDIVVLSTPIRQEDRIEPGHSDIVVLSLLDSLNARVWASRIAGELTANSRNSDTLVLTTKRVTRSLQLSGKDSTTLYKILYASFVEADPPDWIAAKFMFKQIFSKISRSKDGRHVYLLGTLPYKKERLVEPNLLMNLKHSYFTIDIKSKGRNQEKSIQDALVNALRSQNSDIQINAY